MTRSADVTLSLEDGVTGEPKCLGAHGCRLASWLAGWLAGGLLLMRLMLSMEYKLDDEEDEG